MSRRIGMHDTGMDILKKISEGNAGALSVLMQWMQRGPEIDPESVLPPLLQMCTLDDLDIVGPRVWVLYKDLCGQDLRRFLGILRAHQLGYLPTERLQAWAERGQAPPSEMEREDRRKVVDGLLARVEAFLPQFQRAPETSHA